MARRKAKSKYRSKRRNKAEPQSAMDLVRWMLRWVAGAFWGLLSLQAVIIFMFAFLNPPTNYYMFSERVRLGPLKSKWLPLEEISPQVARAVVAAEDANFCEHFGFDLGAIRSVVTGRSDKLRGASTISQQVAKNVFLWPARSWIRKGLEVEVTLLIELFWTKRRILEVYINIAEFDEGVFGVPAAAVHYFGINSADLSLAQAAKLAAILPDPKRRSAATPSEAVIKRSRAIMSGANTIAADGRNSCFQS